MFDFEFLSGSVFSPFWNVSGSTPETTSNLRALRAREKLFRLSWFSLSELLLLFLSLFLSLSLALVS